MPALPKAFSKTVRQILWQLRGRPCATLTGPGRPWKAGNRKSCGASTATSAKKLTRPFKKCIVFNGKKINENPFITKARKEESTKEQVMFFLPSKSRVVLVKGLVVLNVYLVAT
jgi:hypothetical protein